MATLFFAGASPPSSQGRSEDDVRPRRWFAARRGEPAAAVERECAGQWLSMARDDTCCVADVCDFPIRRREGALWITSPEDPNDRVVATAKQLSVTSRGTILVLALAPSSMWVPQGFAVDDARGTSRRRMRLRKLRDVAMHQHLAAHTNDEPRGAPTEAVRPPPFQKLMSVMDRVLPFLTDAAQAPRPFLHGVFQRVVAAFARRSSSGAADARERHLSRSVDHADVESRLRTWDARETRMRRLPPVL